MNVYVRNVLPMDMENKIETTGLGAGSYPEPSDSEEKCYQFEFEGTIGGLGIVYAKNILEAREKAENNDYDDIIETWGMKVEKVTEIDEE